ncbi:MAG: TRAP transporter small permease subunit [Beijerinckiaceae bacterium]|nr:TRAP transporter small permease subunit [Beijerinckiaceae bacterium]
MFVINLIGKISDLSGKIAAVLVLPLVFAMVFEVISRYVFSSPTIWAFELSYMMMGTIFLLGLSYALHVGQHVNVDFIHQRLHPRMIGAIDAIAYLILTAMLVWMTITLVKNVEIVYRTGEGSGLSAWNPVIWPYRVIYVVGFAAFALQSFGKCLENILVVFGAQPGKSHP